MLEHVVAAPFPPPPSRTVTATTETVNPLPAGPLVRANRRRLLESSTCRSRSAAVSRYCLSFSPALECFPLRCATSLYIGIVTVKSRPGVDPRLGDRGDCSAQTGRPTLSGAAKAILHVRVPRIRRTPGNRPSLHTSCRFSGSPVHRPWRRRFVHHRGRCPTRATRDTIRGGAAFAWSPR